MHTTSLRDLAEGRNCFVRPLDAERRALVVGNVRYAYSLAWKQWKKNRAVPVEELKAEALYALSYAASKFDPSMNAWFRAFAKTVIYRHLRRAAERWIAWKPRGVRLRPEEIGAVEPIARPELSPDVGDELARVRRCLLKGQYDALHANYGDDCIFEEIGRARGVSRPRAAQIVTFVMERARASLA